MPKEAFGGDDDSAGGPPEKKKIALSRFGLSPDANIRDVFWKIMGGYAATKKPGMELAGLANDRFSLMRASLSVIASSGGENYGLSPKFVALYSLMMLLEAGWKDAFLEFLQRGIDGRGEAKSEISQGLRKLITQERYRPVLLEWITAMIRGRDSSPAALFYIAGMDNRDVVSALKKELMIIARGDIGQNQLYAIKALTLISGDEDIRKSLIILLSHWDAGARNAAAEALVGLSGEADVRSAAEKRLAVETDEDIKKMLSKILGR
ncbi:MAG: hypothetical protein U0R44_02795 [Candidatus Micrarchaeia archaeon]